MPDKTKAVLVKELASANRRASKAEKALAQASEEAEEGVAAATAKIAELEATISGGRSHNSDGHVCPRTGQSLPRDEDVYSTEKRLRAERNDWRTFSGGVPGMRGSNELAPKVSASVPQSTPSSATSTPVKSESLLRQERNAARKAAGGHAGQRGPNNTDPGKGLSTSQRLAAETAAWQSVGSTPKAQAPAQSAAPSALPVNGDVLDKVIIEVTVRKA